MPGDDLGAERLNSLRGAIAKLADESADVVLVAGDVFDGAHVDRGVVEVAARAFDGARKPNGEVLPIVVIPGNHDPADATPLWQTFRGSLSADSPVRLALEPELLHLCDGKLLVEAYPCQTRYSADPPWAPRLKLPGGIERCFHVVLAHGTMQGGPVPEGESDAYPFTRADAEALSVDYVALGHFHTVYPAWSGDDELERSVCYCGTHEALEFRSDAGWAILATLEAEHPTYLRRVRVGKREWHLVEITGPTDLERLRAVVHQVENDQVPTRFVLRVNIAPTAKLSDGEADKVKGNLASLQALGAHVDQHGEFQRLVNVESLDLDSVPAGAVKEALLSLREDWEHAADHDQRDVLESALQLGWEQFQ